MKSSRRLLSSSSSSSSSSLIHTTTILLLLQLLLFTAVTVHGEDAPQYSFQSTSYAVPPDMLLSEKHQHCASNFGKGATLLDMKTVQRDFAGRVDEFNKELTGVFFKIPMAALFVTYDGTDRVDTMSSSQKLAILESTSHPSRLPNIDDFGNARVVAIDKQAALLCAVPVSTRGQPKKPYVPKEENANNRKLWRGTRWNLPLVVVVVVALGYLVQRRYAWDWQCFPVLQEAYYHLLERTAAGNRPHPIGGRGSRYYRVEGRYVDDHHHDLQFTTASGEPQQPEGCELSYTRLDNTLGLLE